MKYFSIFILFVLSINYSTAQNDETTLLYNPLRLPSKAELARQLNEQLADEKKWTMAIVENFNPDIFGPKLTDSIVQTLTPIIYVKIYPDTLDSNNFKMQVMDDHIILWSPGGHYYFWTYKERILSHRDSIIKYNLNIKGGGESRISPIKNIINSMLPKPCLFTFFTLNGMRWSYQYVGYEDNGVMVIKDASGTIYNNLNELISNRYGSIEDYVYIYKKELRREKTNWHSIKDVKATFIILGLPLPTDLRRAIDNKDYVIGWVDTRDEKEEGYAIFLSNYKYDDGQLMYEYANPEINKRGWIAADKVRPIE